MKNYFLLIIATLLLLISNAYLLHLEHIKKEPNVCYINKSDSHIICDDLQTRTERMYCHEINGLYDKYGEPEFISYEDKKINLYFSSDFFRMYHSKNIKSGLNLYISNLIIKIAENIEKNYASRTENERARLMLNELLHIKLYYKGEDRIIYLFEQNNDKLDDLFCNAFNHDTSVYPVITVDETTIPYHWIITLSFHSYLNDPIKFNEGISPAFYNHDFLITESLEDRKVFSDDNLFYHIKVNNEVIIVDKERSEIAVKIEHSSENTANPISSVDYSSDLNEVNE